MVLTKLCRPKPEKEPTKPLFSPSQLVAFPHQPPAALWRDALLIAIPHSKKVWDFTHSLGLQPISRPPYSRRRLLRISKKYGISRITTPPSLQLSEKSMGFHACPPASDLIPAAPSSFHRRLRISKKSMGFHAPFLPAPSSASIPARFIPPYFPFSSGFTSQVCNGGPPKL